MSLEPVDLAWAAGLFEGEGSVRINSRTHRNLGALLVDVVNVQPEITAFFADVWGGYHRQVEAQKRMSWASRTPEYAARQHEFYLAMRTLNLRGVPTVDEVAS